jgi:hypothetical protein
MKRNWLSVLIIAGATAGSFLATGCMRSTRAAAVPIEGIKLPARFPTAVEVENFNGSVHIYADPQVKEAKVAMKVRPTSRNAPKPGHLEEAVVVKATASIQGAERLLRITGSAADSPPKDVALDLFIRVPQINATRVRNAGGPVELVRVGGTVAVENGAGGRAGGDVQVRTGEAMTDTSTISTTNGKVLWQVGPGSSGKFDLVSDTGQALFTCRLGEVSEVVPDYGHYRGTLNSGTNAITLRSGSGSVQALVIENADTYGPELWDGWPVWPTKPRFIGRLGGYYNDEPAHLFPRRTPATDSGTN